VEFMALFLFGGVPYLGVLVIALTVEYWLLRPLEIDGEKPDSPGRT
jgi:hypothetical protein